MGRPDWVVFKKEIEDRVVAARMPEAFQAVRSLLFMFMQLSIPLIRAQDLHKRLPPCLSGAGDEQLRHERGEGRSGVSSIPGSPPGGLDARLPGLGLGAALGELVTRALDGAWAGPDDTIAHLPPETASLVRLNRELTQMITDVELPVDIHWAP